VEQELFKRLEHMNTSIFSEIRGINFRVVMSALIFT